MKNEWKEALKDKVEEMNNYTKGWQKDWEETRAKIAKLRKESEELKKESEEKLERERKSWKEDPKVQIKGFKDWWRKVLRTVQDKEMDIQRLKEMVVDK